jgi:phosphatidylserine/phosphatidylglycerophosphate/cardiolipin synthase-like enzyme
MTQYLIFLSLLFQTFLVAEAQTFDVRFTNPQCKAYGTKPQNAYCTRADLPKAQANPKGPYQKVIEVIKNEKNTHITLGTMTFSNKGVAEALCQAIKGGVGVTVIIDAGAEQTVAESVKKCGAELVTVGTVEDEDKRGDLHHNKFLLAEGSDESTLVFATGNFSNPALSINHETWTTVTDSNDSDFIQNHQCLIAALKDYTDNLAQFRKDLNKCRQKNNNQSKIESLFIPADSAKLIKLIEENIKSSSQVLMASNRYSFDRITQAFANSKSTDSRAIFDDDLYWGGIQPNEDYVNEALDSKKIAQLERTSAQVRFTQTSFGAAQKMHNKFIVFDKMVLVGAANFTYAGMTANFENFYVIRDTKTVALFKNQFEYLWKASTPRHQMPKDYVDFGVQ